MMPFPRRRMHSLGCDRLSGKSTTAGRTTRLTTSCELRSTDCGRSCEFFLEPRDVVSLIHAENVSQKSEDNLAIAEAELDKQASVNQELSKKVDELHTKTEEAVRLKDQVDEYDDPLQSLNDRRNGQLKVATRRR
jgi:hypothetical protein